MTLSRFLWGQIGAAARPCVKAPRKKKRPAEAGRPCRDRASIRSGTRSRGRPAWCPTSSTRYHSPSRPIVSLSHRIVVDAGEHCVDVRSRCSWRRCSRRRFQRELIAQVSAGEDRSAPEVLTVVVLTDGSASRDVGNVTQCEADTGADCIGIFQISSRERGRIVRGITPHTGDFAAEHVASVLDLTGHAEAVVFAEGIARGDARGARSVFESDRSGERTAARRSDASGKRRRGSAQRQRCPCSSRCKRHHSRSRCCRANP